MYCDTDKSIENMAPKFDLVVINATVVTASDIRYRASGDSIHSSMVANEIKQMLYRGQRWKNPISCEFIHR